MKPRVIRLPAHDLPSARLQAARYLARRGRTGVWIVQCLHDDGCTAVITQADADCTCRPDFVLMSYRAHRSFLAFDRLMHASERGVR